MFSLSAPTSARIKFASSRVARARQQALGVKVRRQMRDRKKKTIFFLKKKAGKKFIHKNDLAFSSRSFEKLVKSQLPRL